MRGRVDRRRKRLALRSRPRINLRIRRELTDAQWARIEGYCSGKEGDKGRHGEDNRLFVDAVLWIARTGAPRRDLPDDFGNWNGVFQRFRQLRLLGSIDMFPEDG
jgi:transposase